MSFEIPSSKSPERPSIEEQFDSPEVFNLAGADIEINDVSPEKQTSEVPTLFGLGWSATPSVYRENILALVREGRRVISPNAPHGIDTPPKDGYPAAELRKVAAVIETLNEKKIDKVDAVAHSEAGLYITIAAALYPERFRNLVLVDSAGIIGPDTFKRLAVGFSLDVVRQVINDVRETKSFDPQRSSFNPLHGINQEKAPPKVAPDILSPIKILSENPLQSIRSVFAIANSDIREMLREIHKEGIKITIVHAEGDLAFPMDRVKSTIGGDDGVPVDGFYEVAGTHNSVILNPQPFMVAINHALNEMGKEDVPADVVK